MSLFGLADFLTENLGYLTLREPTMVYSKSFSSSFSLPYVIKLNFRIRMNNFVTYIFRKAWVPLKSVLALPCLVATWRN